MTRVFICDDSPALRLLVRTILEADGDIAVVGEAGDGEGLIAAVRDCAADVIVLDLSMPRGDGLEALPSLRAAAPELGIVVLSGSDRAQLGVRTLMLGADRYLEKTCGLEPILAAVRMTATGRRERATSPAALSAVDPR